MSNCQNQITNEFENTPRPGFLVANNCWSRISERCETLLDNMVKKDRPPSLLELGYRCLGDDIQAIGFPER